VDESLGFCAIAGGRGLNSPVALLVANRGFALTSSRSLLIRKLVGSGFRVGAVTRLDEHSSSLRALGAFVEPIDVSRKGIDPLDDLGLFADLYRIYRKCRPVLIHHFHSKPVIIGTLAARCSLGAEVGIVDTITGLGRAYMEGGLSWSAASIGYRLSLQRANASVFQNSDDADLFVAAGLVARDRVVLVSGSGVDTVRFQPNLLERRSSNTILMVSRLLVPKGVREYVEAAQKLRRSNPSLRFLLAGEVEPSHPDAIPAEELQGWLQQGDVEYLGYRRDLDSLLPTVGVVVLPSYREGVPRVVLEAASCGIPCVGADVPGTRDAIVDGKTGYLVPPKDSESLANAIDVLVSDSQHAAMMGAEAREYVVRRFDVRRVTDHQLEVYRSIGISC
jgi:glycosyltransferase involved in cell wall biosynthesis